MRFGFSDINLSITSLCRPARGGSTIISESLEIYSKAFSLGARIALAFLPRIFIFFCISRTAFSLISTNVTLFPPIVKPIEPTPEYKSTTFIS